MQPAFTAGFFLAWTPVYLAAAGLSLWAGTRSKTSPELRILGVLFATFAIGSAAVGGVAALGSQRVGLFFRVADASRLLAPALLLHYAVARDAGRAGARLVLPGYGLASACVLHALWGARGRSLEVADVFSTGVPAHPHVTGRLAEGLAAFVVVLTTGLLGRTSTRDKRASTLPFLAACGLAVTVAYDAIAAFVGGGGMTLTGFGFAGFTLVIFVGQLVDATQRRDVLVAKTHELRKRSEDLGRSFKELRMAQNELVRKEQLTAIGELSAVIAHEVRNPLAVIQNAVSTLRRSGTDADTRETLLGILSEETSRLNQLVGDLLHYARPLSLEPEAVCLREIVDKAIAPLKTRVDVSVVVTQKGDVPKVGGDPLLLRQAVDNLINNAAQAMQQGGQLAIEIYRAEDEPGVYLIVRDDGEGMDTVVRQRALDPFFTTRPTGTGLGLAIVARVVDAHGGRLRIKSERGTGTEVTVLLPTTPSKSLRTSRARLLPPVIEPFGTDEDRAKRDSDEGRAKRESA